MKYYRLIAATQSYLWGGKKLFGFGKSTDQEIIAESWELSFRPEGKTMVETKQGLKTLESVLSKEELGTNCEKYPFFPVLIKFIDACQDLSIQVHPSDEYALKNEDSFGKTEMWYVIDAEEGAMLHIGFDKDYTKEEVAKHIKEGTILSIMNHIPIHKGDCYFIPSGTLHAIGKGSLICEIQENSNLTYRVFDYNRIGKDGKPRELHIEKAIKVVEPVKYDANSLRGHPLVDCSYFYVDHLTNATSLKADAKSFISLHIISGSGSIEGEPFKTGNSFFIPANQEVKLSGNYEAIICKAN